MALNEETGSLMAAKELLFSEGDAEEIEMIRGEINLLRSLSHENIVAYLGTECAPNNTLYIFTEWVPGGNLQQLQKKFGTLSETVVRKYTAQILTGLNYLHENHVIHRDIKGANILVDDRGTIKLTDFGASKRMSGGATLVDENQSLRGTPFYMAPEVIMQVGHGRKADVWSVGCTVLQMLSGNPPWKDKKFDSPAALLYHIAHAEEPPELPVDVLSDVAISFLKQCLALDPNERPNVQELLQHPFLQKRPAAALPPRSAARTTPEAMGDLQVYSSYLPPKELLNDLSLTEPSLCLSPKSTSSHFEEFVSPASPAVQQQKDLVHKSTELLRQKKKHDSRRHSHGKIDLNPIKEAMNTRPHSSTLASPEVSAAEDGSSEFRPRKSHDDQPIGTSFAQKQLLKELVDKEKKQEEKRKKNELWQAELAAELEYQRQY